MKTVKKYTFTEPISAFSSRELQVEIVKAVLAGAFVAGVFVAPGIAPIYRMFNAKKNSEKLRLRRAVKSLSASKKIRYKNSNNIEKISVTNAGRVLVDESAFFDLTYTTPKKWDGTWYFVMFDLPVKKERERKLFRLKLLEIGFVPYQDSVYVFPYTCRGIIKTMTRMLGIDAYVSEVIASDVEGSSQLKKQFKLP